MFRAIRRLRNSVVVGEIRPQRYCVNHYRNVLYQVTVKRRVMLHRHGYFIRRTIHGEAFLYTFVWYVCEL